MPSASISLSNMSQVVRDTYQANGLIRSHQQPAVASSQTSLQKLPASSPQYLYHLPNNNNNNQQQQQQTQNQQQQMQFPPPPQTHNMSQMLPQNMQLNKNDHLNSFNPLIVPQQHQQQPSQQQLNNISINMVTQQHQSNGISASNNNLTQQQILMPSMMAAKNSQSSLQMQQQTQFSNNIQQQQPYLTQQQLISNQLLTLQNVNQQRHNQQMGSQQQLQPQQQVPMTTIMIPATAAAHLQSASMQIQQAAIQATANNPSLQQTPQILVFMIPYMINQPPPTIPTTPEQNSLNSTLVRHSNLNSSMMRQSNQHQQSQPQIQQQPQQPLQQQQQPQQAQPPQHHIQPQTASSHSRAVSSLSTVAKHEGEKFYVKANFSYQASRNRQELCFQKGEILHVLDTLQTNKDYGVQYWLATRVNPNGEDADKGLIPNKARAEEIALEQRTMNLGEAAGTPDGNSGGVLSASVGRVNFLKRRAAQRSKSFSKDNWDNVVFDIGSHKQPVYERVVFKHPGFCRPVVIFGPLSDIAREKLLKDYPEKYSYPTGLSQSPDHPKVIRLKGVYEVIDQGKHALLDITAPAVEKLNYVNLAPIVIFMKTDSKSIIKEFRSRAAKSLDPSARDEDASRRDGKSSRKLLEQSMKLEKQWFHVFTSVLDLSTMGSEMWYRKLRETIENQQSANVWMGEKKSEKKLAATTSSNNITSTSSASANVSANEQMLFSMQGNNNMNHNNNQQKQTSELLADDSSMLNERFNDCLNISITKSTNDLQLPVLPPSEITYGNRSQLRNAYAHSLAQKLARASSEPKLNGLLTDNDDYHDGEEDDQDEDDEDDDEDDDDEIIKKPFPSEFENSSSISSSNGAASYGQCSLTGPSGSNSNYQFHYQMIPQPQQQQQQQIVKPPPPTPDQAMSSQLAARMIPQQPTESIYSTRNPLLNSSFSNNASSNVNQHNRDYHPLPPMVNDNTYGNHLHQQQQQQQQHNQSHLQGLGQNGNDPSISNMATGSNNINGNSNNIIDLSRNHEARGSAFQVYSDPNQNNYHYYNMNKI